MDLKFSLVHSTLWIVLVYMNHQFCNCAKILALFSSPFKSHFICNNAVARSLKNAGHEVTIFTSFPEVAASENYTRVIDTSKDTLIYVGQSSYNDFRQLSGKTLMGMVLNIEKPLCNKVFRMKEYQDILNSENRFDVILVEILQLYKCMLPIAQKFSIPVIGVSTVKSWHYVDRAINNMHHPAEVPFQFINSWGFNNIYERFINAWCYVVSEYSWHSIVVPTLKEFYYDNEEQLRPYVEFLDIEPSLIFYNSHHTYLPRTTNPNMIEIGGLQVSPAKPLPKNIKKFIEEAASGVILFSFGSLIRTSTLPNKTIEVFKTVFARIPQKVIWKFEDEMENVPSNVMLMKWAPQRDILEHRNVRAFISHAGQGSIYEAIESATPIIACPLAFDQPANSAILEKFEVAVQLDIDSLSEESVSGAIDLIINDTKYYKSMQYLSKAFKDRPMTPEQSVVYWTEYIIRHNGAPNMKTASSQLNWFQYFLLDILSIVVISVICIIYFSYLAAQTVMEFCRIKIKSRVILKNKLN